MDGTVDTARLEEVFATEGVPKFTFVKPPNYNDILLDFRHPGKPVIVEGQSGTGKTTCIRQIVIELEDGLATEYLSARKPDHVKVINSIINDGLTGRFVIDDFHRLDLKTQSSLADIAKVAAEIESEDGGVKLIIIGINQIGSDLIQLVPDIAKRTGIHRIQQGTLEHVTQIIERGSERLNITIASPEKIYNESGGDYWLTQQLCKSICMKNEVLETSSENRNLTYKMHEVRISVINGLKPAYYPAIKEFCRGTRFRPSNDPYFKLLRVVSQQDSSVVDLNAVAADNPEVKGSINNIKDSRLNILIGSKPNLASMFYYNNITKNFAIEDPALFYYIRHLDWEQLRRDSGFKEDTIDYEFEIALSFAGENRDLARHISTDLSKLDVSVFYDENFESNFLGHTWTEQFKSIFAEKSRFVICLLDENHERKIWPTFEREHFMPRVAEKAVIPIFLDDTKFVGISQDIVGIKFDFNPTEKDWKAIATEKITLKIIDYLDHL